MDLSLVRYDVRDIADGIRALASPYGHRFGGENGYAGVRKVAAKPPVHLLFRLNTEDPAVGAVIPGMKWLPLLCAIRYGACELGYRVLADDRVEILHQSTTKEWDDFPTPGYPDELPLSAVNVVRGGYNPDEPASAWFHSAFFGLDHLSTKQRTELTQFLGTLDWLELDWEGQTLDEYVEEHRGAPFIQGVPDCKCPDTKCAGRRRKGNMRVFAWFQESDELFRGLWGPNGENLQIIYMICQTCHAIVTVNQCT